MLTSALTLKTTSFSISFSGEQLLPMGCSASANCSQSKSFHHDHTAWRYAQTVSCIPCRSQTLYLTTSEVAMVKHEWYKLVADTDGQAGDVIFRRFLENNESSKSLFGLSKVPKSELLSNPNFLRHGIKMQEGITLIVDELSESNKSLGLHLFEFGTRHKFMTRRNFDPNWWESMGDAMMKVMQRDQKGLKLDQLLNTWAQVVKFIIESMQMGYQTDYSQFVKTSSKRKKDSFVRSGMLAILGDPSALSASQLD